MAAIIVGQPRLVRVQNCRVHVLQRALCLRPDIARDEVSRRRVDRNLARAKQQVTAPHGVVVGTDRRRGFGGSDDSFSRHI